MKLISKSFRLNYVMLVYFYFKYYLVLYLLFYVLINYNIKTYLIY